MKNLQQQKGFTLVELAIVLTIIGLLIGGILKGQQLIANAKVTAQMAQVQGLQAAVVTFQDTYAALPGDLNAATTRLPTFTGLGNGNGDGMIGAATTVATTWTNGSAGENVQFWVHLAAANLISGIVNATGTFGNGLPVAKLGGGLVMGTFTATAPSGLAVTILQTQAAPAGTAGANAMTPNQAAQIDRKTDDGNPQTGTAIGAGFTTCTGTTYTETAATKDCSLVMSIQ